MGRAVASRTRTPRFQALPGPKPVLGLGQPRPRATPCGHGGRGRLRLACPCGLEPSLLSPPWVPRGSSGWPRPCGAVPRVFLAFDNDEAGLEATEMLAYDPAWTPRRLYCPPPRTSATWPSLSALPHGRAVLLRLLCTGSPLRPLVAYRQLPPAGLHFPLNGASPLTGLALALRRFAARLSSSPTLTALRKCYAHFTTGHARARIFPVGAPTIGHSIRVDVRHIKEGDTKCPLQATTEGTQRIENVHQ